MRVNVSNISITLTDSQGVILPSAGFLNVFRKADGTLVSGKKSYPTEAEANQRRRPADGWTFVGIIRVEEYLGAVPAESVAKAAVIAAFDKVLAARFNPKPAPKPAPKLKSKAKPKTKAKKKPAPKSKKK